MEEEKEKVGGPAGRRTVLCPTELQTQSPAPTQISRLTLCLLVLSYKRRFAQYSEVEDPPPTPPHPYLTPHTPDGHYRDPKTEGRFYEVPSVVSSFSRYTPMSLKPSGLRQETSDKNSSTTYFSGRMNRFVYTHTLSQGPRAKIFV